MRVMHIRKYLVRYFIFQKVVKRCNISKAKEKTSRIDECVQ